MAGFQTGAQELTQAAGKMEDTNQQLQSALSQLANEVEQVQGAWSGSAASAFQTLMEQFQSDAKNLNNDLNQIAEAVTGNAKAYAQQEEESQQSINSIVSALNG